MSAFGGKADILPTVSYVRSTVAKLSAAQPKKIL
jgi:hypothetical protein